MEGLTAELDRRGQEVASLTDELTTNEERSKAASACLAEIQKDRAGLESRLAAANAEMQQLQAERQAAEEATIEAEQRLAALEAEVRDAENCLATVAAGLTAAEAGRREAVQQGFRWKPSLRRARVGLARSRNITVSTPRPRGGI